MKSIVTLLVFSSMVVAAPIRHPVGPQQPLEDEIRVGFRWQYFLYYVEAYKVEGETVWFWDVEHHNPNSQQNPTTKADIRRIIVESEKFWRDSHERTKDHKP